MPFALISACHIYFLALLLPVPRVPPSLFLSQLPVHTATQTFMQKGKKLKPSNNVKPSLSTTTTRPVNSLFPPIAVNSCTKGGSGIVPATDGEICDTERGRDLPGDQRPARADGSEVRVSCTQPRSRDPTGLPGSTALPEQRAPRSAASQPGEGTTCRSRLTHIL